MPGLSRTPLSGAVKKALLTKTAKAPTGNATNWLARVGNKRAPNFKESFSNRIVPVHYEEVLGAPQSSGPSKDQEQPPKKRNRILKMAAGLGDDAVMLARKIFQNRVIPICYEDHKAPEELKGLAAIGGIGAGGYGAHVATKHLMARHEKNRFLNTLMHPENAEPLHSTIMNEPVSELLEGWKLTGNPEFWGPKRRGFDADMKHEMLRVGGPALGAIVGANVAALGASALWRHFHKKKNKK